MACPEPRALNPKLYKTTKNCPACLTSIMPACCPIPPANTALSRTRVCVNGRPVSAASNESRGMRRLLPVAAALMMMMTSAALGVARAQGVWSTAQLSVARSNPAAASVGNVALFAGGFNAGALLCREGGVRLHLLLRACFVFCACCGIAVMFALRPLPLSCAPLQAVIPFLLMLWMCTTVQQGHGRRLSSAWSAIVLQLHLSGTSLCSLGVSVVRCCAVWGGSGLFVVACVFCVVRMVRYCGFCLPCNRFLFHARHCRWSFLWSFCCCGHLLQLYFSCSLQGSCYRCIHNDPSHNNSSTSPLHHQPQPPSPSPSPTSSPSPLHRRLRLLLLPRLPRHQRHVLRVRSRVVLIRLLQPHAVQLQRLPFWLLLPRRRLSAERVPKRHAGNPRRSRCIAVLCRRCAASGLACRHRCLRCCC